MQKRLAHFGESRDKCAICGSDVKDHLQLAHIVPLPLGGTDTPENIMVLCAACNFAVDSLPVDPSTLREIKRDWTEQGVLGAKRINQLLSKIVKSQPPQPWSLIASDPVTESFVNWAHALEHKKTFDTDIQEAQLRLKGIKNEDEFIRSILWPLFVALGFEDVTILHHTGFRRMVR